MDNEKLDIIKTYFRLLLKSVGIVYFVALIPYVFFWISKKMVEWGFGFLGTSFACQMITLLVCLGVVAIWGFIHAFVNNNLAFRR